jgi:hypothetical protein
LHVWERVLGTRLGSAIGIIGHFLSAYGMDAKALRRSMGKQEVATASEMGRSVSRTVTDMVDFFISPTTAGWAHVKDEKLEQRHVSATLQLDALAMERMSEFELCVEMLRDCMEAYRQSGQRDVLTSAEECLRAVDELLQRVAELTFAHRAAHQANGSITDKSAAELLEVMRSSSFRREHFMQSLLSSGLGVSGMLEAALGELTEWQAQPTEEERCAWEKWDEIYKELLQQAGRQQDGPILVTDHLPMQACCGNPCPKLRAEEGPMLYAVECPSIHRHNVFDMPLCGSH